MEIYLSEEILSQDQVLWSKLLESNIFTNQSITYGTSGFRFHNSALDFIVYRVGFFAALISKKHSPKSWGVMITASHNPQEDNGVKIINHHGDMMEVELESMLERFVNNNELNSAIKILLNEINFLNEAEFAKTSFLHIGYDTRESSSRLKDIIEQSASQMNCKVLDDGYLATPHLYFIVDAFNKGKSIADSLHHHLKNEYFDHFGTRYLAIMQKLGLEERPQRVIDCANGAGYLSIKGFIDSYLSVTHDISLINTENKAKLNDGCGAEHVQKLKALPLDFPENSLYGITLDGDADRMVYFINNSPHVEVIDADKASALFAKLVLTICKDVLSLKDLDFGVVMTNYSNFGLKDYLEKIGVKYAISQTGVKYAHVKALQYEIGMFFESNGHGTLIVKPSFLERIKPNIDFNNKEHALAWDILSFTNNLTGDGVFNILFTEVALKYLKMSVEDYAAIFTYKKYKTYKLKVKTKSAVITDEIKGVSLMPPDLQPFLDELLKKHLDYNARIYIRASGTEDVLRVHIEAKVEQNIEELQAEVDKFILGHPAIN